MKGFWKWLGQRSFMRDTTPKKFAQEELGLAVLRFVDESGLQMGQTFVGAIIGHRRSNGAAMPPTHFTIEFCDTPEICFGPMSAEGFTVQ